MGEPKNGLFVQYCAKDFLQATNNLTPWEELAYRRIVDHIYTSDDGLLDDDKMLAWSTKSGSRWKAIKAALIQKGKIEIIDGRISNPRCRVELQKTAEKIAKQSAKGKASAEARKSLKNNNTSATAVEPQLEPRCQPTTELMNQEGRKREGKPSLVDDGSGSVARLFTPPADAQFREFYAAYPLKRDPGQAEKAFKTALKKATHAEIMAGVARYAAEREGKDPHYTKHPTTWLNAKAWLNEPSTELFSGDTNVRNRQAAAERDNDRLLDGLARAADKRLDPRSASHH